MQVPEIHLFSRPVKRYSSLSTVKPKAHLLQQPITYTSLLEKKKYSLNPYQTMAGQKLQQTKLDDIVKMNLTRLNNFNRLVDIQSSLNPTSGYTFANFRDCTIKTNSYRSGNPLYPCLNHDIQAYPLSVTQQMRSTLKKDRTLQPEFRTQHYKNSRINLEYQWRDENHDPQNREYQDKHRKYRDIQTIESLNKKKFNVNGPSEAEFQRKLRRLMKEADACNNKIMEHCQNQQGFNMSLNVQSLIQIKNDNAEEGTKYLSQIGNIIKKAQNGLFQEKEEVKSYFE